MSVRYQLLLKQFETVHFCGRCKWGSSWEVDNWP